MSILLSVFAAAAAVVGLVAISIRLRSSAVQEAYDEEISLDEVALNHEMDEFVRSLNAGRAA
jgi:hypothetical protein